MIEKWNELGWLGQLILAMAAGAAFGLVIAIIRALVGV